MVGGFACLAVKYRYEFPYLRDTLLQRFRHQTVEQAIARSSESEARLSDRFGAAHVTYPPADATLVALKREQILELWARSTELGEWQRIHTYPIEALSGHAGPKLREDDRQVPEGLYKVTDLNPNSAFHLSLHLDYPNAFETGGGRWTKQPWEGHLHPR